MTDLTPRWEILGRRLLVCWQYKPADLWIGAYWRSEQDGNGRTYSLWVCLLPCLPLFLSWHRPYRR